MSQPGHYIAIFGGAVSGAETAHQFAKRGIKCVIFDQSALPYGKIEDGLPKWHVKLRDKEEGSINEKLAHPNIEYVPNIRLGKDIEIADVISWGFSAVILATGAWKDRPLPVDGVDEYKDKGLYYQNEFVYWFNHKHESNYSGKVFTTPQGGAVIGGGLASIDMIKVLMMETVTEALKAKGHDTNIFELDKGINKTIDALGYTLDDLGVTPATLYYRRRVADMPITPATASTPEEQAKLEATRVKIMEIFKKKFLFKMEELHSPVGFEANDGNLTGLVFQKNEMVDGRPKAIAGSDYTVNASVFISSIGSIPEPIPGLPMVGQTFDVPDMNTCKITGFDNLFAVGNAVTGRGNIKESLKHGTEVSQRIMNEHMEWMEDDFQNYLRLTENKIDNQVDAIMDAFSSKGILDADTITKLDTNIKDWQLKSGYDGNWEAWVETQTPERLENQLGVAH